MTEQELRELDAWIAEYGFGWSHFTITGLGYLVGLNPETGLPCDVPAYTKADFASVKREIERRGWIWQAACEGQVYDFGIFNPADGVIYALDGKGIEVEVARILAGVNAETEEIAGCLAFKAAVEAEGCH